MNDTPLVHRVGEAVVTRIAETGFSLPPDVLYPDWDAASGMVLAQRFAPATFDAREGNVFLQTHLWVVDVFGMTVVIDTGIGNGKSRPFSKLFDALDNPVPERLQAAGIRREQVDHVLLTHLHVDHVGWNTHWRDGAWRPGFPNATYVFSQGELDYFARPEGAARRMVFEDSVLPVIEAKQARVIADAGEEIVPGIRFLPAPGHSSGHMAIEITSQGQTMLFCGDVMHSPLQVYRPAWNSMFCQDAEKAAASRDWLLDHAARTGATLFPAHFPETSAGRVSKAGDAAYEWRYL